MKPLYRDLLLLMFHSVQFISVAQSCPTLCDPMDGSQTSLSITNSWSLLKLMSIESMMTSNHLILCSPLFRLPSIFPSIRVFSNESAIRIRWPKYWNYLLFIKGRNSSTVPGLMQIIFLSRLLLNFHSFLFGSIFS